MKSEALLIAKEQTRAKTLDIARDLSLQVLTNPAIQMLLFVMLVELAQMIKPNGKNQLISSGLGSTLEGVVITTGSLKTIADAVGQAAGAAIPLGDLLKVIKGA
jgi:hypothetical protein